MRQMFQALAATAPYATCLHDGPDHQYGGAGGYDKPLYDLVLGYSEAERLLPSEEGQPEVSIPHVLGLCKATGVGIRHGYEFRERHDVGHFDPPHGLGFCCVPTEPTMNAGLQHARGKSHHHGNVNWCSKQVTNSVRVPKRYSAFVAASPSPSRATIAGEVARNASPAPIHDDIPEFLRAAS